MYRNFNKYILRTPTLSVDFFLKLTGGKEVLDEDLRETFSDPLIKEAIYLASPVLYQEIKKWAENKNIDDKIKTSFIKYLSRMSSRPTPFGLFSGCSLGVFGTDNRIERINSLNKRYTRLDMDLTGVLVKHIENVKVIKEQLLFYSNNSIYKIGELIRFVESRYNKNNKLVHKVIEVENSEYLEKILNFSEGGKNITELSNHLVEPEISFEEAKEFIVELIDSQILVSELQQTVSGTENLDNIISILDRLNNVNSIANVLVFIKNKLVKLDNNSENNIKIYLEILNLLKEQNITVNPKFAFQTDLILGCNYNILNENLIEDVQKGLKAINRINRLKSNNSNPNLNQFKEAFYERYDEQEVPLSLVLDKELGIGYPVNSGTGDINPLIDNLVFRGASNKSINQNNLSIFELTLLKKSIEAKKENQFIIEIKENEIPGEDYWDDLPDTFSTLAQVINISDKNMVHLDFFAGSSAGNLLGRFCNGDSNINKYINEIVNIEEDLNSDKIVAEIVHLPEDRLGNVLMRPSMRNFEIPYLARSNKNKEQQIPIKDILVSIKDNNIFLKSKKYNKEIIPRLTTAHNFVSSTLPVYRFLCEIQSLNKRNMIMYSWNSLGNYIDFFPRTIYQNIILSTAKWKVKQEEITRVIGIKEKESLLQKMNEFRISKKLPKLVYFVEGDNKILINLENISSIKTLFSLIKNKSTFLLEEFLFAEKTICHNPSNENYVNEFIFSFFKN